MRRLTVITLTLVVILVLFLSLCTFTVRPYEQVILDRFGKLVSQPTRLAYNWYLKLPTDTLLPVDTRLHLYQSNLLEANTGGSEPISVKCFAAWRIIDAVAFYQRLQGQDLMVKSILDQKIPGLLAQRLGRHQLDEILNTDLTRIRTEQIEKELTEEANAQLNKLGLEIAQVGFSRLAFPPVVANDVYKRMSTERFRLADRYRSLGDSQAAAIRAEGEQKAAEIKSQAEAAAQALRGQGDADAFRTLAEAQKSPEAQEFYRYWKSVELFKASMTKNTYLVLTPENPLMGPFFKSYAAPAKSAGEKAAADK